MKTWGKAAIASGLIIGLLLVTAIIGLWRFGLLPLLFPPAGPLQILGQTPAAEPPLAGGGTGTIAGQPANPAPISGAGQPGTDASQTDRTALENQIDDRYIDKLRSLSEGYEGKLNGLSDQAMNEYLAAKQRGEKVSLASIAARYISSGSALEKQCDAQFYPILAEYKAELLQNGFSPDMANRAQQEYEYAKASRKKQMLSAAASFI